MTDKTIKKIIFICFLLIAVTGPYSKIMSKDDIMYLNSSFYYKLWKVKAIKRDNVFQSHLNKRIQGRGKVIQVKEFDRYRKRYRIELADTSASKYRFTTFLYIFLNNEDTAKLLKKDDTFDFKGQLMAYTPLNSQKNSYILDIILEDGAVVIE